ncbi:MAG: sodium/proline symporter PutP [Steroidobacteraceae bacterium]|jgi:sodium/proline symporter|nr:sodium/proline symporter PutP [Steroidobacteraceae bacterium]
MIENPVYIVGTMVLYMSVCLGLGWLAWRRTHSLADFILGGRSLGSWVTALSAQATDMSGWLLMGLPGLAYASGLDAAWMAGGLVIGTWANWRFVAAPLRARTEALQNSLTLPDYFEHRFGDASRMLRTLTALLILVFFIFYTSSGFVAAGKLFQTLFDIEYAWAMFWGSIVMLAYTFFGGFLAVSWSDVLQGTLMFVALVLVALLGLALTGGVEETLNGVAARNAALLDPGAGDAALGAIGVISLLAWGLGYPGQPHVLARFMAVKSPEHLKVARRVAMSWVVVVLLAAIIVGLTGVLALREPLTGGDVEKVFILMATTFLHPVLAGVCLSGILAAVMSTAAAQLLVASSAFAQDLYKGLLRPTSAGKELLWVGRAAVLAVAVIAFMIALDPESKVLDLVAWAWAGFGSAFGPAIVLSLYWPRMTRNGALAGMLVGGLTVMLWRRGEGEIFQLYEMAPGVLFATLAIWVVSALENRRTQQAAARSGAAS